MIVTIIVTILLVAVLLVFSYCLYMSRRHGELQKLGFKGPSVTNPITGNVGNMEWFKSMAEHYKDYKHHKVYAVYLTRFPWLVISSLDMIKDVFGKNSSQFPGRHILPKTGTFFDEGLFCQGGEQKWKHMRKNVSPIFSTGKLKQMSSVIEIKAKILLDNLIEKQESGEAVELKEQISGFTLDVIGSTVFGVEVDSTKDPQNIFAQKSKKFMTQFFNLFVVESMFPFLCYLPKVISGFLISEDVKNYFEKFVNETIKMRQTEGKNERKMDFIQLMVDSANENQFDMDGLLDEDKDLHKSTGKRDGLTYAEMQSISSTFLSAGYETTAHVVAASLFCMSMNTDVLEKAQEEIDQVLSGMSADYHNVQDLPYLEMCICETMRLYPPGFYLERVSAETTEVQGITIPKGYNCMIPIWAIHRDPDIWTEPDEFKPERFTPENKALRHPCAYLPFGSGPRICIGMRLAQIEMKIALATILQRITPVKCEKSVYPIKVHKYLMKAEDGMWVKFDRRH